MRQEVIEMILNKHFATFLDTGDAADKIGGKQLSTNAFMTPIAALIHHGIG